MPVAETSVGGGGGTVVALAGMVHHSARVCLLSRVPIVAPHLAPYPGTSDAEGLLDTYLVQLGGNGSAVFRP